MAMNPKISESRPPGPTPFVDYSGADAVRRLREDAGKTWNGLAAAIKRRGIQNGWTCPDGPGTVDADTIRRIEEGHLPSLRVQVVLCLYFGVDRRAIWKLENRRPIMRAERLVA